MKKLILLALVVLGVNFANAQKYTNADAKTFSERISVEKVQLLDVRTSGEYVQGHIKGAKNINLFDKDFIAKAEKTLNKKETVYVYCRSGGRSARASASLAKAGYKVVNLSGGILGWQRAQYPIAK